MCVRKTIILRLDREDYKRLEVEAQRQGMRPGALVGVYVRTGLRESVETETEQKCRIGLAALDRLAQITADLPPIDAVQIASQSREALEQRSVL